MRDQKLFVEKVKVDSNGRFLSSEALKATDDDIKYFESKPCNHSLEVDKLIYDEIGTPWDFRYCGVCGTFIGYI